MENNIWIPRWTKPILEVLAVDSQVWAYRVYLGDFRWALYIENSAVNLYNSLRVCPRTYKLPWTWNLAVLIHVYTWKVKKACPVTSTPSFALKCLPNRMNLSTPATKSLSECAKVAEHSFVGQAARPYYICTHVSVCVYINVVGKQPWTCNTCDTAVGEYGSLDTRLAFSTPELGTQHPQRRWRGAYGCFCIRCNAWSLAVLIL